MNSDSSPVSLFYSYAHKDETLRDELATHLATLEKQGLILPWYDRQIKAGQEWADTLDEQLNAADIILLLITQNFMASDYCYRVEMGRALERYEAREAEVIPIVLRPGDYTGAPFMKLQGLPKNFKPVTQWANQDEAFADIAKGIRRLVEQLQAQKVKARSTAENPFGPLNGMVDDPQQFFGRDRELTRIFELLNSHSSVAVIGERQVGKSSLLRAIARQAATRLNSPRQTIYLNLHLIESDDDFYTELCEKAEIPLGRGAMLARSLRAKRVLLLLDEVEKMTWQGFTAGVRSQLRGLAEGADAPLRLVLAARTSLDRLFPDAQETGVSPLSGICLEERVAGWNEAEMRGLITQRLAKMPICFTEAEMQQLMQESRGTPSRLTQLCYRLFQHYREGT